MSKHRSQTISRPPQETPASGRAMVSVLPTLKKMLLVARDLWPAWILGIVATLWVLCQLDAGGLHPTWPEGPGLTIDESFNVQQGVFLSRAFGAYGLALLNPLSLWEIFQDEIYLADHPPLGRLWLGLHHDFLRYVVGIESLGQKRSEIDYTLGRAGSATAFGLTVMLVTWWGMRWAGRWTGIVAGLGLMTMPRVFAHAHLASLETVTNLACTGFALAAASWCLRAPAAVSSPMDEPGETVRPTPAWLPVAAAGAIYGLALLTKIQAVLLLPPMLLWLIAIYRLRAARLILVAGLAAGVVFFCWPWLWSDPAHRTLEYLGRATKRATLSVWYFDEKFSDRLTPWHYPWVTTAITISLPVLILCLYGSWQVIRGQMPQSVRDRQTATLRGRLLLLFLVTPLIVFSLPGVAVYDGERLFLTIFPLVALLSGLGLTSLLERLKEREKWPFVTSFMSQSEWLPRGIVGTLFGLLAIVQLSSSPFWLSTYSGVAGSTAGGAALGMEASYWGDGLTRSFWKECEGKIPRGAQVAVAPVLHQFQLPDWKSQVPAILRNDWQLIPLADVSGAEFKAFERPRLVVIFWRKADLAAPWQQKLLAQTPLVQRSIGGVLIAGLYELPAITPTTNEN